MGHDDVHDDVHKRDSELVVGPHESGRDKFADEPNIVTRLDFKSGGNVGCVEATSV